METMRRTTRSPAQVATSRALDADIERTLNGGESPYGDRASFIPIDLVTAEGIRESHAVGHGVVIVDEQGNEEWLPAAPEDLDPEAVAAYERSFQGFGP